jgi:hypothetical protein
MDIEASWHQPDHTAARGRSSTQPARASSGSASGRPCGSPQGVEEMPHPAQPQPSHSSAHGQPSRRPARPARAWTPYLQDPLGDQAKLRSYGREGRSVDALQHCHHRHDHRRHAAVTPRSNRRHPTLPAAPSSSAATPAVSGPDLTSRNRQLRAFGSTGHRTSLADTAATLAVRGEASSGHTCLASCPRVHW